MASQISKASKSVKRSFNPVSNSKSPLERKMIVPRDRTPEELVNIVLNRDPKFRLCVPQLVYQQLEYDCPFEEYTEINCYYLVHLIACHAAGKGDRSEYVRINSEFLKMHVVNCHKYMKYMEGEGIIEIDHALDEDCCKGYRIASDFWSDTWVLL